MKKIILTLTLCLSYFISKCSNEMSYEAVTYINNVSSEEVPRFIELHKKFTDMGVGKKTERLLENGFLDIGMAPVTLLLCMTNIIQWKIITQIQRFFFKT